VPITVKVTVHEAIRTPSPRAERRARLLAVLVLVGGLAVLGGGGSASAGSQAANGRIAYVSDGACRFDPALKNEDIFSMAPDGTGKADLSRNPNPDGAPAWSADGTRLAFVRPGKGSSDDIFVMTSNGKGQRNLTRTSPDDANPDWTPDGSKVTYDVGGTQIFASNADGTSMQRLIPGGFAPAWAPSGQQIAYTQNVEPSNSEIFAANADGSGARNLTNATSYDDDAATWSPDGTKIAFTRYIGAAGEIFVMNADGSGLANLTNDPASDGEPTWSPDGTRIAFATNRGPTGDMEIYVMNADGSNSVNLTNSPANESDPDWQAIQGAPPPAPGTDRLCKVPNLAGKSLGSARSLLRKAGCAGGTVKYARSKRPRGRVVRQTPRKRVSLCFGVRVNVVVSRGLR
jgi:Tol biopolymer transport system component